MSLIRTNPFLIGLLGSFSLLLFYIFVMVILTGSFKAAYDQFLSLWLLMTPLIIGFGIQLGLYQSLRFSLRQNPAKQIVVGNTVTSTVGMIACCAHHLTEVLPILGLSAVSVFLVNYQTSLLLLGILFNLLGILYLLRIKTRLTR